MQKKRSAFTTDAARHAHRIRTMQRAVGSNATASCREESDPVGAARDHLVCLYRAASALRRAKYDARRRQSQLYVSPGSTINVASGSRLTMAGNGSKCAVEGNLKVDAGGLVVVEKGAEVESVTADEATSEESESTGVVVSGALVVKGDSSTLDVKDPTTVEGGQITCTRGAVLTVSKTVTPDCLEGGDGPECEILLSHAENRSLVDEDDETKIAQGDVLEAADAKLEAEDEFLRTEDEDRVAALELAYDDSQAATVHAQANYSAAANSLDGANNVEGFTAADDSLEDCKRKCNACREDPTACPVGDGTGCEYFEYDRVAKTCALVPATTFDRLKVHVAAAENSEARSELDKGGFAGGNRRRRRLSAGITTAADRLAAKTKRVYKNVEQVSKTEVRNALVSRGASLSSVINATREEMEEQLSAYSRDFSRCRRLLGKSRRNARGKSTRRMNTTEIAAKLAEYGFDADARNTNDRAVLKMCASVHAVRSFRRKHGAASDHVGDDETAVKTAFYQLHEDDGTEVSSNWQTDANVADQGKSSANRTRAWLDRFREKVDARRAERVRKPGFRSESGSTLRVESGGQAKFEGKFECRGDLEITPRAHAKVEGRVDLTSPEARETSETVAAGCVGFGGLFGQTQDVSMPP
jgi:hypothetical protein